MTSRQKQKAAQALLCARANSAVSQKAPAAMNLDLLVVLSTRRTKYRKEVLLVAQLRFRAHPAKVLPVTALLVGWCGSRRATNC